VDDLNRKAHKKKKILSDNEIGEVRMAFFRFFTGLLKGLPNYL
jgi:hypothetical protein